MISMRGKYSMGDNSRINIYCPLRFTLSKVTSFDETSRNGHLGLNKIGQSSTLISSSVFEHGIYGLNNSINPLISKKGSKLYVQSSTFYNCYYGYRQYKGGFDFNNCQFTSNASGIIGIGMEINSSIKDCNFETESNEAVRFDGTGTSSLSIEGSNLQNTNNGVFISGNTQLNMKCSTIGGNKSAIQSYMDGNINISSQMNENGNVTFSNIDYIMLPYHGGDIFLAEGYNQFLPSAQNNTNNLINGTLNRFMPDTNVPLSALLNNWNNTNLTPVFNVDYRIKSTEFNHYWENIYYEDLSPTTDQLACINLAPCTNCDPQPYNPLKNCEDCEIITTTHISSKPLNDILETILLDLKNLNNGESEPQVEALMEILTFEFSSVSEDERYLLKYAYRTFKDEIVSYLSDSSFLSNQEIDNNSTLINYINWITAIFDFQKQVPETDQLFSDLSILKLDEALMFRLNGDLVNAHYLVNELLSEVQSEKLPFIYYWDCLLQKEELQLINFYTNEDFDTEINSCWDAFISNFNSSGNRLIITQNLTTPSVKIKQTKIKKTEQNQLLNIFPNPSNGIFTIIIPETAKLAKIVITDLYGRKVKEKILQNTNQAELNMNDLNDGYYNCTVTTENAKYERKISKIE